MTKGLEPGLSSINWAEANRLEATASGEKHGFPFEESLQQTPASRPRESVLS